MNRLTFKSLIALMTIGYMAPSFAQKACVFDVMGTSGENYQYFKDYALKAKSMGVTLDLNVYTDEKLALDDFQSGKCDVVSLTGSRARSLNPFVSSLEAFGLMHNQQAARAMFSSVLSKSLVSKMSYQGYEVTALMPMGFAYLHTTNRDTDNLVDLANKKIAVFDWNQTHKKLTQRVGAVPVITQFNNMGSKFINKQVDLICVPALVFKPLEIAKGLAKGGIGDIPIFYVSTVVITKADQFPVGFGEQMRTWSLSRLPKQFNYIAKLESDIPSNYWIKINNLDRDGYFKMLRLLRIDMTREGLYDKSMMRLAKGVRCKLDMSREECSLKDE